MNPITGPFFWAVKRKEGGYTVFSREVHRYRQKRPYNLPLPYLALQKRLRNTNASGSLSGPDALSGYQALWSPYVITDAATGDSSIPWFTDRENLALQKALKRFNSMRGEAASLGVTLAQYRQALDMMSTRLLQGLRDILAIRRGRWRQVLRRAGRKPSLREGARKLSALQLEMSFGWLPMIGDVQDALKVLDGPLPYGLARGTATIRDILSKPSPNYFTHKVRFRAEVAAFLQVENPTLDLAQRMGLLDPIGIVYEIIPWSFVANWFFNLEEYLAQMNPYLGVRVINPYYSIKVEDDFDSVRDHWSGNPAYRTFGRGTGDSFRRVAQGLPGIRLGLRPSIALPLGRALNAISLLIQKGIRG